MQHVLRTAIVAGCLTLGLPALQGAESREVHLYMTADAEGGLAELKLDGMLVRPSPDDKRTHFDVLRSRIRDLVEDEAGRRRGQDFTAVLEFDRNLKFEHVVAVLTAIRGRRTEDGEVVDLITKIKISAPAANPR